MPPAAALAGTTQVAAQAMVDELRRAHLIEPAAPDAYRMHDLLKAYAREQATAVAGETERQAAQSRLYEYYVATSVAATRVLYTVVVVAFDADGNRSPQSPPFTSTTRQIEPEPTCEVFLLTFGQGYHLTVTVENMTTAELTDWSVTFTLPTPHSLPTPFNSVLTRDGDDAALLPAPWAHTLPSGARLSVGGIGSRPADSPLPSDFAFSSSAGTVGCS